MKTEIYSKPGSDFEGKTLKEILKIIKDKPFVNRRLEEAKKPFERLKSRQNLKGAKRIEKWLFYFVLFMEIV